MPPRDSQTADSAGAARQPLVVVLAAAAVGIGIDRFSPLPAPLWWSLSLSALAGWFAIERLGDRRASRARVALILAAVASCAAAWGHANWYLVSSADVGRFAAWDAQPVCLDAVALSAPSRLSAPPDDPLRSIPQGERSRVSLRVVAIRDGAEWLTAAGEATLTVDGHLLGVSRGDRLRVFARLRRPSPAMNPGAFDTAQNRRADRELGALATSYPDCVSVLEKSDDWNPFRFLDSVRAAASGVIQERLSEPAAPLAEAMLLGRRDRITDDRREWFVNTGTAHILAVSGLHVGMLALGLFFAMRAGLLRRSTTLALVALLVIGYALIAETRPPVVRAMSLIVIVCFAQQIGRRSVRLNALAAAALFVLLLNPSDLFRVGPQLSFLAVAALVWWFPRLEAMFPRRADPLDTLLAASRPWPVRAARRVGVWAAQLTLASAVVWLVTLPLALVNFHVYSPLAIVLNTALWIPLAAALLSGFAMLGLNLVAPPLAGAAGWICDASFQLIQSTVETASAWPLSHFWTPGPAVWWICAFYAGLIALVIAPRFRPRKLHCYTALLTWVAIGLTVAALCARPDDTLRCTFVYVGHGSAVVLETPDRRTILYDAGSLSSPEFATRSVSAVLWSQGIRRLDAVVLSHADVDHYNALPGLLERFDVRTVLVSPLMFDPVIPQGGQRAPNELRRAVERGGVPMRTIYAGDRLRLDPRVDIRVLHPPPQGVIGGDNANSLVLLVQYAGRRILLPGDLEEPGLRDVMAELPIDCDVVLAPHHGSARSNPPGFAAWTTPDWLVVSGGADDRLADVAQAYKKQGAQVLYTAQRGGIEFKITPRPDETAPQAPEITPRPATDNRVQHPADIRWRATLDRRR